MRKLVVFLTVIVTLASLVCPAYAEIKTSAGAVILMHADTGEALYEHNADESMLIASTTKIMTALVALEHVDPDEIITIPLEATLVEGSSMYLKPGESYRVRDVLMGLMLVSGNDAALAIAMHVGGSVDGFAQLMNDKAEELGLENTSFKNPHGLDADGHYSTARDLAVIMRAAMENETFREITGTKAVNIGELTYVNHNKLLWRYPSTTGGKTGYTMAAGRSLVSTAERGGLSLICVTLSAPDDWNDHASLYDWAFANFEYTEIEPISDIRIPVISGDSDTVGIYATAKLKALNHRDAETQIKIELPRFVFAGIRAGETVGRVMLIADGEIVAEAGLCYAEDVNEDKGAKLNVWERFKRAWFAASRFEPALQVTQGPVLAQTKAATQTIATRRETDRVLNF